MIGYLTGLIIDKEDTKLLVLTGGVGYSVAVTTETLSRTKLDEKIQLFIHTAVREDDIALYGFPKKEELTFFRQLISVSGIGPKIGMDILSTPLHLTQNAILCGDAAMLTAIKGIGKKTAERMILELKGKVTPVRLSVHGEKSPGANEDAMMALVSLGYEKFEVMKAMAEMPRDVAKGGTEVIIKHFLKNAA